MFNVPIEDMLEIRFTRSDRGLGYGGVLHLLPDHSYTEEEIEAMKDEKYNRWMDFVEEQSSKTADDLQSEGA